jgi:hypothetical protein
VEEIGWGGGGPASGFISGVPSLVPTDHQPTPGGGGYVPVSLQPLYFLAFSSLYYF